MIKVFSLDTFATPKISVCMKNKFLTIFIYTNMYIYVHKYTNTCICIYVTPFHWSLERERNVSSICRKHSLWCTLDEEKTVPFWFFFLQQHSRIVLRAKLFVLLLLISWRAQKIWHLVRSHTVYSSFPWTSKWFGSEVPSSVLFHPLGKIMIKPIYLDLFMSHTDLPLLNFLWREENNTSTTLTGHWGQYQMIHSC